MASMIVDGKFTYTGIDGELKQYDIASKTSIDAPEKKEWQNALDKYDSISYPNEDVILLIDEQRYLTKYVGFINKNKQVFIIEE
jgi:hypothetical protein